MGVGRIVEFGTKIGLGRHFVLAIFALAGLGLGTASAQQSPIVVGGSGNENVVIDWSVLETLGPAPTLPGLLRPGLPSRAPRAVFRPPTSGARMGPIGTQSRIVLRPPQKRGARATASPKSRARPSSRTAKRRAAPTKPAMTRPPRRPAIVAKPKLAAHPPPTPSVAANPVIRATVQPPRPPPPVAAARPPAAPVMPPPPKALPKAPAAKSPPRQTAALKQAANFEPGQLSLLAFARGSAKLDNAARKNLKAVAEGVAKDRKLRLQLLAYAGSRSVTASQARRLSLSRALAVRSYLIEQGVRSTRIDVRALGNKSEAGPTDRVDVIVINR